GLDNDTFVQLAEAAKAGCPVSQALSGTTITLDAALA
ncbi:MAG TPA: peroxiredoxin, partial [Nocardioides sp.]